MVNDGGVSPSGATLHTQGNILQCAFGGYAVVVPSLTQMSRLLDACKDSSLHAGASSLHSNSGCRVCRFLSPPFSLHRSVPPLHAVQKVFLQPPLFTIYKPNRTSEYTRRWHAALVFTGLQRIHAADSTRLWSSCTETNST